MKIGDRVMVSRNGPTSPGLLIGRTAHGHWIVWLDQNGLGWMPDADDLSLIDPQYRTLINVTEARGWFAAQHCLSEIPDLAIHFNGVPQPRPRDDLRCCSCYEPCPYAEANPSTGTYQCWSCRSVRAKVPA